MKKSAELFEKENVTNGEAKDFMFAIMNVFKNNELSKINKNFTNEQCWNILSGAIRNEPDNGLINEHIWRNIKRNFSKYAIYIEAL